MYHPAVCDPTSFIFALLWFSPESTWKIHGLWPETCKECENCGYPSYCRLTTTHFNESTIKKLRNKLDALWYPGNGLIEHEWMKHGSCDGNVTEFVYFNTTLALWNCVNYSEICSNYIQKGECRILLPSQQIQNCL